MAKQSSVLCGDCGELLGTNRDCESCMEYLVTRGKDTINEDDAEKVVGDFEKWQKKSGKKAPTTLFEDAYSLYEMLRDSLNGSYSHKLPWKTIAGCAFALIYLINPFDLVPDFIPIVGWLDDAGVIGATLTLIARDIAAYREWKEQD